MEITSVRLVEVNKEMSRLKAIATIVFEDVFVVRDIRVIEGDNGLFIAMPSFQLPNGNFKDICHPINNDFQDYISKSIIEEYQKQYVE
ncbi:MAG: septation regulator SpoVG [Bacilli bacterium]